MRYLVKARVKGCKARALARAIEEGTLGQGSIAGDEYLYDMEHARLDDDGTVLWVESVTARRRFRRNVATGRNTSS